MKKNLTLRHRLIVAIPYSLLHFLTENNLLHKYCNNVVNECKADENDLTIKAIEEGKLTHPEHYFTTVFVWHNTPEGYNYWYRRANWYADYINNLKTLSK